jgi:hypothetical protein
LRPVFESEAMLGTQEKAPPTGGASQTRSGEWGLGIFSSGYLGDLTVELDPRSALMQTFDPLFSVVSEPRQRNKLFLSQAGAFTPPPQLGARPLSDEGSKARVNGLLCKKTHTLGIFRVLGIN